MVDYSKIGVSLEVDAPQTKPDNSETISKLIKLKDQLEILTQTDQTIDAPTRDLMGAFILAVGFLEEKKTDEPQSSITPKDIQEYLKSKKLF